VAAAGVRGGVGGVRGGGWGKGWGEVLQDVCWGEVLHGGDGGLVVGVGGRV
jgi:hypothetical protein